MADVDVALLQEVAEDPSDETWALIDDAPFVTSGWESRRFRSAVVARRQGVLATAEPVAKAVGEAAEGELGVSRPGTIAVATVAAGGVEPLVVASVHAVWERPIAGGEIFGDGPAHRIISDLTAIADGELGTRLLVAGDWNILHGYGEHGSRHWARRYQTVFDRLEAIGLVFVGPQQPWGRAASPWPEELPADSDDVPTYHRPGVGPAGATRQLDFVFASAALAEEITSVRALNQPDAWGPSDHCRVLIELAASAGPGPVWAPLLVAERRPPASIERSDIPTSPGVYAWFRNGRAIYVGQAKAGLRNRLTKHLDRRADLSKSAFRRNVCEMRGIAPTSVTRAGPLADADVNRVNDWIDGCTVAWLECASPEAASDLEDRLKEEWKPPLTKR